uniref:Uncharacterized protein n=1 Tax=Ascaris lumbricoides TaxID=6252 RepID=A0A9J2PCJ9_ASCLU
MMARGSVRRWSLLASNQVRVSTYRRTTTAHGSASIALHFHSKMKPLKFNGYSLLHQRKRNCLVKRRPIKIIDVGWNEGKKLQEKMIFNLRIKKQTELNATNKALTGNQLLADIARGIAYLRYQLVKMNESLQIKQQLPSNDRNRSQEESTKYIASDYFAVHAGGGLGNILFEFISVIGIARSVGR